MKFSYIAIPFALVSGALGSLLPRNECNANNCARAVTGTNAHPAASIRRSDCSSYMQTTFTPAPTTITYTSTEPPVTSIDTVSIRCTATAFRNTTTTGTCTTVYSSSARRSFSTTTYLPPSTSTPAKTQPTYASACEGSEYSSACSCWGITAQSTTVHGTTALTTTTVPGNTIISTTTVATVVTVTSTAMKRA